METIIRVDMWIIDLVRAWQARSRGVRVHKGDHLRVLIDIRAIGLAYYRAPYTGGFRCTIPAGSVVRVYHEPGPRDLGFQCSLVDPDLEASLVPAADRLGEKYAGHAFAFGLGDIGRRLEQMPGGG